MLRALISLVVLSVAMAACTLGYGDKLDPRLVYSSRLTKIDVTVAPDARFWWGGGERAYAASIGGSVHDPDVLGRTRQGGAVLDPAFGEPVDRMATNLAESHRNWLVRN